MAIVDVGSELAGYRITEQVAAALDAARHAGLVHRDIKPANVLLAGEHTYLSDFGIGRAVETVTRLTDTSEWVGTVDFCSPEQLWGERTDALSDVYSLGCLLHTALTGTPPHHRETTPATMFAHLNEPPPPPSLIEGVTSRLDAVLAVALAKRPADRYPTAGGLARAARAAVDRASDRNVDRSGYPNTTPAASPSKATEPGRPVPGGSGVSRGRSLIFVPTLGRSATARTATARRRAVLPSWLRSGRPGAPRS